MGYYSFTAGQEVILPFINAVGSGPDFAYHKAKNPSFVALLPVSDSSNVGACICASNPAPFGKQKGAFSYVPVDHPGEKGTPTTISFPNSCPREPRGDLLKMRNPTCDVRHYLGGQSA